MAIKVALSSPAPARTSTAARASDLIASVMDTVSDLALFGFASWTLLYHLGLIFGFRTDPLLLVWVLTLPLLLWWLIRGHSPAADAAQATEQGRCGHSTTRRLLVVAVVLALASAGLVFCKDPGIASTTPALWWSGWILAAGSVGIGLTVAMRAAGRPTTTHRPPSASLGAQLMVLAAGVGLAYFSLFIVRSDNDDIYYVNRSAWVAEHGTIPTRDTIFTDQHIAAIRGAGVPLSSIETYQGAIAHVLHVSGGSAAYLLTPPVGVLLSVWAMWRLVRRWAPRRYLLCMAVALTYLVWAGHGPNNLGEFFIDRMQHGKSIFVSMLVPLLYLYLTRWAEQPARRNAVFLAVAGIAAVGLTSSATFVVPLICATVALPLFVLRRHLAGLGSLLPFAYPFAVGMVVHLSYSAIEPDNDPYTMEQEIRGLFGSWWFGAFGWAAAFCAVWLLRPVIARCAVGVAAAVLLVLAIPPVLTAMTDFTSAQPVVWRSVWVIPIPILVGMLASIPLPARVARLGAVPAIAWLAVILATGAPPISSERVTSLADHPTWRFATVPLSEARAVLDAHPGPGPVLAPLWTMRALAVVTTRVHAVYPFGGYVELTDESQGRKDARALLGGWAGGWTHPTVPELGAALDEVGVGTVCVRPEWTYARSEVLRLGYTQLRQAGTELCYSRYR